MFLKVPGILLNECVTLSRSPDPERSEGEGAAKGLRREAAGFSPALARARKCRCKCHSLLPSGASGGRSHRPGVFRENDTVLWD